MTELTRVSEEEWRRREKYMSEGQRQYNIFDPFTWSMPAKNTFTGGILMLVPWIGYNLWYRKPWHSGFAPKSVLFGGGLVFTYYYSKWRAGNYAERDAVIDHYMQLRPEEFKAAGEYPGRPYRDILLPWIPIRGQYTKLPSKD